MTFSGHDDSTINVVLGLLLLFVCMGYKHYQSLVTTDHLLGMVFCGILEFNVPLDTV